MINITKINLINKCLKGHPVTVCFFDPADSFPTEMKIHPWQVVRDLSYGFYHPIDYSENMRASVIDGNGNHTELKGVMAGKRYEITKRAQSIKLIQIGESEIGEIEVMNCCSKGAFTVALYRESYVTAQYTNLAPGDYFTFSSPHKLLARQIQFPLTQKKLRELSTDGYSSVIDLKNVRSADLVMLGGGGGVHARPYEFVLNNVVHA